MEIEQKNSFENSPEGWARRWAVEMDHANKFFEDFEKKGNKAVKEFIKGEEDTHKLRLWHSDVKTKYASLYGNIPQVQVGRRYGDANDDAARVAGEMIQRQLNCDIESDSDTYKEILGSCLWDYLIPGLAVGVASYQAEFETVTVEAQIDEATGATLAEAYDEERKTSESVDLDYVHWRDVRWPRVRTKTELPWIAVKRRMERQALHDRFDEVLGADEVDRIPMASKKDNDELKSGDSPWDRAEVWEIYYKPTKEWFWWVSGYSKILDRKPDPLGLDGFFPVRFMIANPTTDELLPTSDYEISKDQYEAIDDLYERKVTLESALKVAWAFDAANAAELEGILNKSDNRGTPVQNWGALMEKGGLDGCMQFVPIDKIAGTLAQVNIALQDKISLLHQVNGIADIMRGGSSQTSATATQRGIEAKFGSLRLQAEQINFAMFASQLQQLKAEIISKHFDPQTIIDHSNVMFTADGQPITGPNGVEMPNPLVPKAVELLKSQFSRYRIEVKSDQVSMTDYAQRKSERLEALQAAPVLFQGLQPLMAAMGGPQALAVILEMWKWGMAGLPGSSGLEGIFDQQISTAQQQAKQPPAPPPPDPKVVAAQMKMQGDQMKLQADMQNSQMKTQADMQLKGAEHQAKMAEINAETQAEILKQQAQSFWNIQEEAAKAKFKAATQPAPTPGGP
jgi:hypothetical protein